MVPSYLYAVYSLNSPGRHFLTYLEVKGRGKNSPKHKPQTKNTRQKCWSWEPSYCGNLSLPSSPLRELDLAWICCFSDGPQPLGIWLQPSALKRKTGFGMVPSPGNIIYMRATDSFVWAHLQPTSSLWGVWRRPEASWLSLLRKELGKR